VDLGRGNRYSHHPSPPDIDPRVIARKWKRVEKRDAALSGLGDERFFPEAELTLPRRMAKRLRRLELQGGLVARLRADGFGVGTNHPPLARGFPSLLRR